MSVTPGAADGDAALREYCRYLARFLANCMVDPHRYFEQKLNGEVAGATTEELGALAGLLAEWAGSDLLDDRQRARLDHALAADGLPSFGLARTDRESLVALLAGPHVGARGRDRLQAALADPGWGTSADRALAAALLGPTGR